MCQRISPNNVRRDSFPYNRLLGNMINKLFTFPAKQHMYAYVLCGMFFALLFVSYVDSHSQKHTLKMLIYPGTFIIIAAGVLVQSFYEKHERGGKKIPINRYGIVMKDDYIPVKITSNISVTKKHLATRM